MKKIASAAISMMVFAGVGCSADVDDGISHRGGADGVEASERTGSELSPSALAFSSGRAEYDAAYVKAVGVISSDVVDGKFIAGESWAQVWTRDTSYSIDLGAGLLYPAAAKKTLLGMTENVAGIGDVWVQDRAGHFGGWPNLTDSIVGAQGAWSLYLTTGDPSLLEWSYGITVHTLARAERDVYIADAGLFGGCSSFMESNSGYPIKYMNTKTLLAKTKALSTNLLYYRGYEVAAKMGRRLGKDVRSFEAKAARLKDAINAHLWQEDRGYYAYFEDENGVKETRMEGTGESFAILWGVADRRKTQSILAHTPSTPWGIPSLWPQYAEWMDYTKGDADYYHNGMVWPFVQGYWAWAATKGQSVSRVAYELDRIRALSEKNDTFQEFYQPETGTPDGSRRQLWSASGYLSMVYHGLIGMTFDPEGVTFAPVVPSAFHELSLQAIPYRNMTLNVRITGSGARISQFLLDGRRAPHRVPAHLTGTHRVDIRMASAPEAAAQAQGGM